MIEIIKKSQCSGCHACASVCPKNCITMAKDEEGFLYPKAESSECIECGLCKKICPILNPLECEKSEKDIVAYAAMNKAEDIRLKSSSGGVFTALATAVLQKGGVVFGAAFNEEFEVVHKFVETVEVFQDFRGSKYVQSTIGDTYKQAERFLKQDRWVLFTGTPCQIGGLLAFLKKSYQNLITQDIICHGVPSPLVWEKYIKHRQARANGAQIRKINFRAKDRGWKQYSVKFLFKNDTEYRQTVGKDPYMQVFLKDLCLRPSCYDCAFRTKIRQSDITLADFWGVQHILPEMDDDKGTSLIFVNSEKGRVLFESIKKNLAYKEVDSKKAIVYNLSMIKSVQIPEKRKNFMSTIVRKPFIKTKKFYKGSLLRKGRKVLAKIKNTILRR